MKKLEFEFVKKYFEQQGCVLLEAQSGCFTGHAICL